MIIDLTNALSPETPVYPGDPPMEISNGGELDTDGFYDNVIKTGTHLGTHIDAPAHMLKNGKTLDAYEIGRFKGRGVLIDAVEGFHDQIDTVSLAAGDIVLIRTDWSKRYHEESYFEEYEALPASWAEALVAARVSLVGLDQCSPDYPPFDIHKTLLSGDVLIGENLCNLDRLEERAFSVWALPLSLSIDGSPARIVAEVHDE